MDLEQMKKILECCCCLDLPDPDSTEVGICSFGHLTCAPCGQQILQKRNVGNCPICRDATFKIAKGHKLAMFVLQLLNNHMMYACKYPNCPLEILGTEFGQHHKTCTFKPVLCPKTGCKEEACPVFLFYDQLCHKSCVTVESFNPATNSWNFTYNINHLYSFDTNTARVSDKFKPTLLKSAKDDDKMCAYVNAITKPKVILFYVGWMDQKNHVSDAIKGQKIGINVYVNTKTGKIGQYLCRTPKFEDETTVLNEEGVYLTKHTLFCWALWANEYQCHECTVTYPHVHISVFSKE